jgi:AsmA protein
MLQTPLAANLEIKGFDLVASGYVPTGAGLAGTIDFNGTLASDGKVAQSKGKATASNLQLVKGGSSAAKPVSLDYDLGYDLKKKTGTLSEASVAFGSAAMLVSGDFDAGGDTPRLKMKLEGNAIPVEELQELLPALGITLPNGASLEGGTLDTEIAAEGTLDDLAMDGTVAITGTRLTGFNLGEKMAVAAKAARLKSSPDTLIEKLGAGMRWTSQGIAVSDIQFVMPSLGSLSGAGTISPQQELDFTMRAVVQPSGGELAAFTKGKTLRVSFFVRGNATDPKFIPDYKDAARGLLDGFLSGQGSTEGATGGTTGKGDTLKDSLRGLFKRR